MIKYKIGAILMFISLLGAGQLHAQSTSALRINEVLTNNTENYMDPFGNRGAWIEIFNNSAGSVEMAGCYITIDKNNPKMYMISKGDISTKIKPRQRILLWADNMPHHGAFHTNFALNPNAENVITLYDASGKRIIDEVTVPVLPPNKSFGSVVDGNKDLQILTNPTPEAANYVENGNPKVENFERNDPSGAGMSLTAMLVVFMGLLILFLVFKQIGVIAVKLSARRALKAKGITSRDEKTIMAEVQNEATGEILAAIAMALHEHENEAHDFEETVLTINRVTRNYSPWSSKIYGLRELPKK